jgi:hypothetical protein
MPGRRTRTSLRVFTEKIPLDLRIVPTLTTLSPAAVRILGQAGGERMSDDRLAFLQKRPYRLVEFVIFQLQLA